MADQHQLINAAARLARTAPQEWQQFMLALAAHTELSRNNCVTSPLETLAVNQGKAQALTYLTVELGECIERQDRAIQRQGPKK